MKMPIAALCLLFLLTPAALFATAEGPDYYAVRNVRSDDVLNIRSAPNVKSKVIGTIPFNAKKIENLVETFPEVKSDMDNPVWCKIKYKSISGWVACKYLIEDSE